MKDKVSEQVRIAEEIQDSSSKNDSLEENETNVGTEKPIMTDIYKNKKDSIDILSKARRNACIKIIECINNM